MEIGIDIRTLAEGKRSGVEEYTYNLLHHLFQIDKENQYKLFYNAFKSQDNDFSEIFDYSNVRLYAFHFPNKILNLSFKFLNFPKIDRLLSGIDVFFSPNILFYSFSKKCKNVITFHDLSFKHYSKCYSTKRRGWHRLVNPKKIASRAYRIIAVSAATKSDLIKTFKIDPEKIKVIHSGVGNRFRPIADKEKLEKIRRKYKLPEKFILFLGTLEPRKNLVGLISAFNKLKGRYNVSHKLVMAGAPGWLFRDIFYEASRSRFRKEIIFTDFIEDDDKPFLYNLTTLFIYPSFYEGFGFPPLEAMACGTPVITTVSSSLPEICGDAALLVDPYNVEELTEAMYQGLTDEVLRLKLIEKGLERAKKFNWGKCAKETLAVFEDLRKR
jgi:glycosyltransferase involved in cell wall biosynthesis